MVLQGLLRWRTNREKTEIFAPVVVVKRPNWTVRHPCKPGQERKRPVVVQVRGGRSSTVWRFPRAEWGFRRQCAAPTNGAFKSAMLAAGTKGVRSRGR